MWNPERNVVVLGQVVTDGALFGAKGGGAETGAKGSN